jgi:outer membrane biosynthesis protein TonB
MRVGLVTSSILHVVLLGWGLISFDATPFETDPVDALEPELVTMAEFTRLREGDKKAEDRQVKAPREIKAEPEPTPPEPVEDPGVNEKPLDAPPTETPAKVAALPQPTPEPEKAPEPEPEPQPTPQAEPEPAPSEPEPEPKEQAEEAPTPAPVTVKPRLKPAAPRPVRTTEKKQETFTDEVAALLNKTEPAGGGTQAPSQPASRGTTRGNDNALLDQNALDALRNRVASCWNPPVGAVEAGDLKVQVEFSLNPDGSLNGQPRTINSSSNPMFGVASSSAERAVLRCGPYDMLPRDKYDAWRDVRLTFDPRDMVGIY